MISNAIFPCVFTDGARIVGELSYNLCKKVYTDSIIIHELASALTCDPLYLQQSIFSSDPIKSRENLKRGGLIFLVRQRMQELAKDEEDYFYYGMFSLLLDSEELPTNRILIFSDINCRVARGIRQEKLDAAKAREHIEDFDRKASKWSHLVCGTHPYNPELYDTIVWYECQDLLDVTAYLYMIHENSILQAHIQAEACTTTGL